MQSNSYSIYEANVFINEFNNEGKTETSNLLIADENFGVITKRVTDRVGITRRKYQSRFWHSIEVRNMITRIEDKFPWDQIAEVYYVPYSCGKRYDDKQTDQLISA